MTIALKNGKAFTDGKISIKTIVLDGDRISRVLDPAESTPHADMTLDCAGKYVFPGFVDLHIHGGGGGYSQDLTPESYDKIVETQVRFGTTSIALTYIGATLAELESGVELIRRANEMRTGARIIGIHTEGPWISPEKTGYFARDRFDFEPSAEQAAKLVSSCGGYLRLVTLAPELKNIESAIAELGKNGIIASCGHTTANYDQVKKAVGWGIKSFTHLWNMSGPILSREPGVVGAALSFDDCWIELVADGFHVHPANVMTAIKRKPADKACLVSDAVSVTGTSETTYSFVGVNGIRVVDGRTVGPNGMIIGSVLTLDKALRNILAWSDLPLERAVALATENPAKLLGLYPQKGSLRAGADADVAVFDENLECATTFVGGRRLYG